MRLTIGVRSKYVIKSYHFNYAQALIMAGWEKEAEKTIEKAYREDPTL